MQKTLTLQDRMESFSCAPAIVGCPETMTATIILVIYLFIFPHIHLPRAVFKVYKQCLSFQALLEFFVFESE